MIPGSANSLLLASAAAAGGDARSVRFNSADSAFLSRTPSVAGNRKTWTWAGWVKRSALGVRQNIFGTSDASANNSLWIEFFNTDALRVVDYTTSIQFQIITTQVFRDVSAWAHLVVSVDTTQGTASNRVKMHWNGLEITQFSTATYPGASVDTQLNTVTAHGIGRAGSYNAQYFSGYLADIHFIDGQALTPTSFGEFDANGVWQPIAYTGTYGTNGFHLPFSDNSTAAALGTDASGNGNTWTVNNISVAAGAGNDSLVDVPTNGSETDTGVGGEVRGNYATFLGTPLAAVASNFTRTNGNLDASGSNANQLPLPASIFPSSGKWYCELVRTSGSGARLGVVNVNGLNEGLGNGANGWCFLDDGRVFYNGSASSYGSAIATNDIFMIALDIDAGKVWYGNNGTWFASGNPATGANASQSFTAGQTMTFAVATGGACAFTSNWGARPFAYTAPSGFKALCTTNLPTPTIADGSTAMDVALYTGNGTTQTISGLGFSPDLVWIKDRTLANGHMLFDVVRGANNSLSTNVTNAENTTRTDRLTAFNSDGFSLGADAQEGVNKLNSAHVAWTWDAGSSTVTNNAGSITSQVRANPSAGFSIVTYTGNGTGSSWGHGLNVSPRFVVFKRRDTAANWRVLANAGVHSGFTHFEGLNTTAAGTDWSSLASANSTTVTIPNNSDWNANGAAYVAYCFAPVAGYSSFGSYTGNNSTDGPFVYTGFTPRWVLLKASSITSNWFIYDSARNTYNAAGYYLWPNLSNAEPPYFAGIDILSNGFKLRENAAGGNEIGTYIYAAFAEHPFRAARAR